MADVDRIKKAISEIANRPKSVRFAEIERIVNQLKLAGKGVRHRRTKESHLFNVDGAKFGVCSHNPGSSHIRSVYVADFLRAMAELGLYEDQSSDT